MRPQTTTVDGTAQAHAEHHYVPDETPPERLPVGLSIRIQKQLPDRAELSLPAFPGEGFALTFLAHKGDLRVSIGHSREKLEQVNPGMALLSAADKPIHFRATAPVCWSVVSLFIGRDWIDEYLRENENFKKIESMLDAEEPGVSCRPGRRQMAIFHSILDADRGNNKLEIQNNALSLLEFLLCNRHKSLVVPGAAGAVDNQEDLHLIREVESYIAECYCSDTFTVDSILKKTYTSYHKLNFLFKSIHGMTISEYIRNKRIERSREMIADNVKSISQIAYEIGYSSISNYILAFKKIYQITPGKYKKQMEA